MHSIFIRTLSDEELISYASNYFTTQLEQELLSRLISAIDLENKEFILLQNQIERLEDEVRELEYDNEELDNTNFDLRREVKQLKKRFVEFETCLDEIKSSIKKIGMEH